MMRAKHKKCILSSYLVTLLDYAEIQGISSESILSRTRLNYNSLKKRWYYVSYDHYVDFVHSFLDHCDRPGLVFDIVAHVPVSAHGLLGLAVICGLNFKQSLNLAVKFSFIQSNVYRLELSINNDYARLALTPQYDMDDRMARFSAELAIATMHKTKEDLTGISEGTQSVMFPYEAPSTIDCFTDFFGCDVLFSQPLLAINFNEQSLSYRIKLANQDAHEHLVESCQQRLNDVSSEVDVKDQVRYVLRNSLLEDSTQQTVAQQLNVSPRTLRRHLHENGITFQCLLDEERAARAKQLLLYSDQPIAIIAAQLGYSDSAHFTKSFKKHATVSPTVFRKQTQEAWQARDHS